MPDADRTIMCDDGPLPSDVVEYDGDGADSLPAPLASVLKRLREHRSVHCQGAPHG